MLQFTMTKLKCPTCGSNDFREEKDKYICKYCGAVQIKPHPYPRKRIAVIIALLLLIAFGMFMAYRLLYSVKNDIVQIKKSTSHNKVAKIDVKPNTVEKKSNPFSDTVQKVESKYGQGERKSVLEKSLTNYYSQEKNKALYISLDKNGNYVTAISYGASTPQDAEDKALDKCADRRKENGIKSRCIPYAVNDHISRRLLND